MNTQDLIVNAADGWTEVATDPTAIVIKSNGGYNWALAISDGDPPDESLVGEVYGGQDAWEGYSITGTVYVKVQAAQHPFAVTQ